METEDLGRDRVDQKSEINRGYCPGVVLEPWPMLPSLHFMFVACNFVQSSNSWKQIR